MLARRGTPHGSGLGRYRWVVERSLAWLHGFKKLKTREERGMLTHTALMLLAGGLICERRLHR